MLVAVLIGTTVREAFGNPIWKHKSIGNYLADMPMQIALNAVRIHGGYG